jgi:hypothetical protein
VRILTAHLLIIASVAALVGNRAALASEAPLAVEKTEGAIAGPGANDADAPTPAVYGLYPLWEQTGAVDPHGGARVGLRRAQVALGRITLATDPYLDIYGALNAALKLGVLRHGPLRLALQLGGYRVPTAAESRGIGNVNAGAFANPYQPLTLLPLSAAATWMPASCLHLHVTATLMQILSSTAAMQATTAGLTGWVEWFATPSRSVRLHAGTEGWPTARQEHVGVSVGLRTDHVALQGGYARRFAPEGTSANTVMFDGALLFQ